MQGAQRVQVLFVLVDRGFSARQLVDHHVVLDQDDAVEAPAHHVSLALEIEEIREKVAVAVAFHHRLVDFVAFAGGFGLDAFLHAQVEVVGVDGGARDEALQDIGIIEDDDVGVGAWVELHGLEILHRGLVRNDPVEQGLHFLVAGPGIDRHALGSGQDGRGAAAQAEAQGKPGTAKAHGGLSPGGP